MLEGLEVLWLVVLLMEDRDPRCRQGWWTAGQRGWVQEGPQGRLLGDPL